LAVVLPRRVNELMLAMPAATVRKITGAMMSLTSLMNASPSGFSATARSGAKCPNAPPTTIAISTWA
jgi:hypothetical protein